MKLYTVKSEGLAHHSYFLSDEQEAVVIDPRRDCKVYTRIAEKACTKIKLILETHRNEDYVVGSTELQRLTNAEIGHGKQLNFKYGEHSLQDNETLSLGNLKIKALHTPGHTDESLSYAIFDPEKSSDAVMVFTGDTLFAGSVGRTDLQGAAARPVQAEKLYISIKEKLLPLGDQALVYPAHGSGSVCGNDISDQDYSTIGIEKRTNPFLKLDKAAFVARAIAENYVVPPYFRKMETYNLEGAPSLAGLAEPKAFGVKEFENQTEETETAVVDTRLPAAYAAAHIPGSLSVWLDGVAAYAGWVLDYDDRVLLVLERRSDLKRAMRYLWRLGFDNTVGFLCSGVGEWQEQGKPISHAGVLSAAELQAKRERFVVLDVREPHEWSESGWIEGAERTFFGHLQAKLSSLERNKRYAVVCSVGNRASIAVSLLLRGGFGEVYNVLGGMTAWLSLGFPVQREKRVAAHA